MTSLNFPLFVMAHALLGATKQLDPKQVCDMHNLTDARMLDLAELAYRAGGPNCFFCGTEREKPRAVKNRRWAKVVVCPCLARTYVAAPTPAVEEAPAPVVEEVPMTKAPEPTGRMNYIPEWNGLSLKRDLALGRLKPDSAVYSDNCKRCRSRFTMFAGQTVGGYDKAARFGRNYEPATMCFSCVKLVRARSAEKKRGGGASGGAVHIVGDRKVA